MDLQTIKQSQYYIGSLPNLNTIKQLPKPQNKEICYCEDEDKLYLYQDNQWSPLVAAKMDGSGIELSLFELNRSIIAQMGALPEDEFENKKDLIQQFQQKFGNCFYMLYGKDISYFTVFCTTKTAYECNNLGVGVFECLKNVGDIYSIENNSNGDSIEIWVKYKDEVHCLYLFPYDMGIVTIGEYTV